MGINCGWRKRAWEENGLDKPFFVLGKKWFDLVVKWSIIKA